MRLGSRWMALVLCFGAACSDALPTATDAGTLSDVATDRSVTPDAKDGASDVSLDESDASHDVARDDTTRDDVLPDVASDDGDGACAPPVVTHGDTCGTSGTRACGYQRDCSGPNWSTTLCSCEEGRYNCGACPRCDVDLRLGGCGNGMTCDGATIKLCDGTTVDTSRTCRCEGSRWVCTSITGGERAVYSVCRPEAGTPPHDAPNDAPSDAPNDVPSDASSDATNDVTFDRRAPSDASCPGMPVSHGMACTSEGSIVCGEERSCTDVPTQRTTDCICKNGRYSCGECPACNVDLRGLGCGIGQACDGVAFTLCQGEVEVVAETCTCSTSSGWHCDNGKTYSYRTCMDLRATPPAPTK